MSRWVRQGMWRRYVAAAAVAVACGDRATFEPAITAIPSHLDFGTVRTGMVSEMQVDVTDVGRAPLVVSGATLESSGVFSMRSAFSSDCAGNPRDAGTVELASGECARVFVACSPQAAGMFVGKLAITSNDPQEPTITIPITATATDI